ncbi:hypothetical protein CRG98_016037 [Punica granatum]|uniref:Uncharacterized protein n=1 Tax=Punica granatum TaxID=22663 RepID=A0A2I0K4V2_PUNGR|nr:hypothetical protein CRG98_016037 [Punica granatum]
MRGRSPKAVDAGPKLERGAEARCSRCWAEARCSRGKSPKVGPKPDTVNAGPKPDAGKKPKSWAEARCSKCWAEARCSRCMLDKKVQEVDWPSGHSSSCRGGRVKAASGLPAKVGTTRLSCGVGGRVGRPLVIARLAMER